MDTIREVVSQQGRDPVVQLERGWGSRVSGGEALLTNGRTASQVHFELDILKSREHFLSWLVTSLTKPLMMGKKMFQFARHSPIYLPLKRWNLMLTDRLWYHNCWLSVSAPFIQSHSSVALSEFVNSLHSPLATVSSHHTVYVYHHLFHPAFFGHSSFLHSCQPILSLDFCDSPGMMSLWVFSHGFLCFC